MVVLLSANRTLLLDRLAFSAKGASVVCGCIWVVLYLVGCSPPVGKKFQFRPASVTDLRAARAWHESEAYVDNHCTVPDAFSEVSPHLFEIDNVTYWDISLPEIIHIGLTNSRVLRDLGGRLVSQPGQTVTADIPELIRSNPVGGVDAALAAFDAQIRAALTYNKTENGLRGPIVGSTIETIQQEKGMGSVGVSKIGQAGTRYSVTHGNIYEADNVGVPPNRFGRAFDTFLNFEARHPMARGGGRVYNATAGPLTPFGVYNGYWIASIKTDIANTELQIATRDYVYNIIRSYWLLRFAYQTAESKRQVLDLAQQALNAAESKRDMGTVDKNFLLQAQERFLAALQDYDDSIAGAPERKLAGLLGANGGIISGFELGLRTLERRLRLLIGIPDGSRGLLRPVDEPSIAPVLFDYQSILQMAMTSRPELHRQMKVIEEKRMEWLAARNLRLPTVDLVGNYRVHGFGNSIYGDSTIPNDSSLSEFLKGNLHDVGGGIEVISPVGNRLATTAERNARVSMSREAAILDQQKLNISYEVNSALAEVERSLKSLAVLEARMNVAKKGLENLITEFDAGASIAIETVLDAKKSVANLSMAYGIAGVDYSIALLNVSFAQGSLLNESNIFCGQPNFVGLHTKALNRNQQEMVTNPHY
jgi:outer membrane protein TolC